MNRWFQPDQHVNVDTLDFDGRRHLQTSVNVTKEMVDMEQEVNPYEDFTCECHAFISQATSGQGTPIIGNSPKTVVTVACK